MTSLPFNSSLGLIEHWAARADDMGEIHKLLTEHGRSKVVQMDFDRRIIDAAANYMGAENGDIGFLYSGWAQSALPHKRLANDASWQVRTDHCMLVVQPGLRPSAVGDAIPVGVPYGSRARLICLYLQSEALKTNSREVHLGRTLHAWLRRLRIPIAGKNMESVRDQAERISLCRMTFRVQRGDRTGLMNQNLLDTALFVMDAEGGKQGEFLERAVLSELFFEQLKRHPVPIEEAAVAAISNSSLAIDLYCWLAYRLHSLDRATPVSWRALHAQFGAGVRRLKDFRDYFVSPLQMALSVYPDARVEVDERGLVLHPSRPPVSPKVVSFATKRLKPPTQIG